MQQKFVVLVLVRLAQHLILVDGSDQGRRILFGYLMLGYSVRMIPLLLHILDIFTALQKLFLVQIVS